MHISNPITPYSSKLRQDIVYCKYQIARVRESLDTAPAILIPALNIHLDYWLGELNKIQDEIKRVEDFQESLKETK
jgi:hypothetical protein